MDLEEVSEIHRFRISQLASWARQGDKDALAKLRQLAGEGDPLAAEKLAVLEPPPPPSQPTVSPPASIPVPRSLAGFAEFRRLWEDDDD